MTSLKRIGIIALAFTLSIGMFLLIDAASSKGKGPISETVHEIEKVFIGDTVNHSDSIEQQKLRVSPKHRVKLTLSTKQAKNPNKILIGYAGSSKSNVTEATMEMDEKLGVHMDLVQLYVAWGSKKEEQFPSARVQEIVTAGSIPVITWEPWLSDFSENIPNQAPIENREVKPLKAIYSGVYDDYIRRWAKEAKRIKSPIYLRFAHEMNDPYRYPWGPHNNEVGDFSKAWIHVYEIFKSLNVNNVIWMWSIHSAYDDYASFYPGDEYVDVVATGILNFGSSVYWSKWWSFDQLFSGHYGALSSFKKPIFIIEFGSLKVGGDRKRWYEEALNAIPQSYKNVKGIVFFNVPADKTLTDKSVTWELDKTSKEAQCIQQILGNWKKSNFLHN
ncbi:MAG: glycoside hydrolase family 26 protein [Flavobacteriales bacterium]|jgi:hypothetical protein